MPNKFHKKIIRKKVPKRPPKKDWYGIKKTGGKYEMVQGGGDRELYKKLRKQYQAYKKKK